MVKPSKEKQRGLDSACCPDKSTTLKVASAIFAIVGLLHLLRILWGTSVSFGTSLVPMGASWVAVVVAGALSWWMCKASKA